VSVFTYVIWTQICIYFSYFVYVRSDTSLDFIAVYNVTPEISYTVSLLERRGAHEYVSIEPLGEVAARDIQSTRSSMCIVEGKMLLGNLLIASFCVSCYSKNVFTNIPSINYNVFAIAQLLRGSATKTVCYFKNFLR
jgi:hypothetical protein